MIKKDHSFAKGEEECLCTFVVVWQHGPIVGCLANKKIENLCLVQSNDHIDPMVAFFLKIVKEKLQNASHTPPLLHSNTPIMKPKLTYAQRLTQASFLFMCVLCVFLSIRCLGLSMSLSINQFLVTTGGEN